jgi:GAF domain-containing protein
LAARRVADEIIALSSAVRNSTGATLSIADMASLLSVRVERFVPYDSLATYVLDRGVLQPEFISGENFHLFSTLRIPLGEGLSGWVAQNNKSILNGNPAVEPGYINDPTKYHTLRSALAVPFAGPSGVTAVLALYREGQDAFTLEDLRIIETMSTLLGATIEGASKAKAAGAGK